MLGAIAGDVIGSPYEHAPIKSKDFDLFNRYSVYTDDTVLSLAVAQSLLETTPYHKTLRDFFLQYPNVGYGGRFRRWARSPMPKAYGSFGNGSAMRVSPIAWFYDDLDKVMEEALHSAEVTHNHPEGIKGAQAVAVAIFMARQGASKPRIKSVVEDRFGYDLSSCLEQIRPNYRFEVSCQNSVPQGIVSFLESTDFEDAVRNAVSLGGDSDTLACIAGGIAEAYYGGVPDAIAEQTLSRLDERLKSVYLSFQGR